MQTILRGANLQQLITYAATLGFSSRPLRLELDELDQLQTPCILHWSLNHFVVLKKLSRGKVLILDPAVGERRLAMAEVSRHFTGVALELAPNAEFKSRAPAPRVSLRALTGKVLGLKRSLAQIFAVAVVLEMFAILAPLFNQMVVDDVLTSGDCDLLTVLVWGFGLLLVIQTAIGLARSWMVIILSQTLSLQWTSNVFAHLIRLPVSFFEKRHLGDITSRFGDLVIDVQNLDLRTAKMSMGFGLANTFIFGLENLLVLWLGAKLIMDGQMSGGAGMTVGMLFAFIAYKGQFTGRVSALINYGVELKMLSLHAERLADIALEPPEKDEIFANELDHLPPSIELKNVSFRYGEGEPWVLKEANFRIEAGESVAVTGPSGAGKTTLLKTALGLLKPSEGEVLFGGMPVRQLGLQNFRRQIGTVMQEDALLTGSLSDNIAFFDVQPDQARIQACAELAQLHADICRMPMGYQTLVGDLGSGLSGGQKQRLLLARALYKQPRVLALDEATSHLDLQNERAVTAALSGMVLTRLIIAHRPETIAGAQRVVMVREGQVMELARAVPASTEPAMQA